MRPVEAVTIGCWLRTVRRLPPGQLAWRLYYRLRPPRCPAVRGPLPPPRRLPPALFSAHHRDPDGGQAGRLRDGRVCFLQDTRRVRTAAGGWAWHFDGEPRPPSRLWMFQWHSFSMAAALAHSGDWELLEELIASWIAAHPDPATDRAGCAWNSYTIANRLEFWAYAHALGQRPVPPAVAASARAQANHLAARLEFDLRGNHLIRNVAALLIAASWLPVPEALQWRQRAVSTLVWCVRRQVLPDGAHYEASPMYHLLVMEDLAQSLALLRQSGDVSAVGTQLEDALRRMQRFAQAMRWGDGGIALWNDACQNVAPAPDRLGERVTALIGASGDLAAAHFFPDAGFAVLQRGGWRVIADGGRLGPEEQPGHAHCDLGAVIASFGGEPILEDTGVFEYQAGPRRRYARSTEAHNTLQVDGGEQGECWGEFRLGRRPRPLSMVAPNAASCRIEYAWLTPPVVHSRSVVLTESELRIDDLVRGSGTHELALRWHFAPGMTPVQPGDGSQWTTAAGARMAVDLAQDWNWKLETTPFYPEFGRECPRFSLTGRRRARLPVQLTTRFSIPT